MIPRKGDLPNTSEWTNGMGQKQKERQSGGKQKEKNVPSERIMGHQGTGRIT